MKSLRASTVSSYKMRCCFQYVCNIRAFIWKLNIDISKVEEFRGNFMRRFRWPTKYYNGEHVWYKFGAQNSCNFDEKLTTMFSFYKWTRSCFVFSPQASRRKVMNQRRFFYHRNHLAYWIKMKKIPVEFYLLSNSFHFQSAQCQGNFHFSFDTIIDSSSVQKIGWCYNTIDHILLQT